MKWAFVCAIIICRLFGHPDTIAHSHTAFVPGSMRVTTVVGCWLLFLPTTPPRFFFCCPLRIHLIDAIDVRARISHVYHTHAHITHYVLANMDRHDGEPVWLASILCVSSACCCSVVEPRRAESAEIDAIVFARLQDTNTNRTRHKKNTAHTNTRGWTAATPSERASVRSSAH